jgi:hypothetical protein
MDFQITIRHSVVISGIFLIVGIQKPLLSLRQIKNLFGVSVWFKSSLNIMKYQHSSRLGML